MTNFKDLYFFHNRINNIVKVGISNEPKVRLKSIKYQSGIREIDLLIQFSGLGSRERDLHKLFSKYKTIGEWFKYTGMVKSYVEHLNKTKSFDNDDFAYLMILSDNYYSTNSGFGATNALNLTWNKLTRLVSDQYNNIIDVELKILRDINDDIFNYSSTWETIYYKCMKVTTINKNGTMNYLEFYIEYYEGKYCHLDYYQ